jgi:phosphoglycolate phosphatase-like HAD superfamily hydrolase
MRSFHEFMARPIRLATRHTPWKRGNARIIALVILLSAGVGGAVWLYLDAKARTQAHGNADTDIRLSDSTRTALKRLRSPVEIRFYSVLREDPAPDPLRAFSGRVDRLLSAYEREAGDTIMVTRLQSRSAEDMDAASSDGIKAFNLSQGEPCYLGLALRCKDRNETLPRLTPEWEVALEADLTRAILQVSGTRSQPGTDGLSESARNAREDIKRAIPDLENVPLEKGRQILRDAAFKELKAAAAEMQRKIEQAQQQLVEARASGSEERQQAAMKRVREAQAAQTEKLKEISARVDAQITALEELKEARPNEP